MSPFCEVTLLMIAENVSCSTSFDLLVEVDRVLQESCYSAVRNICYGLSDGRLVLEGSVPSYYIKQMAQNLVASIAREYPIENQIQVDRPASHRPHQPRRIGTLMASVIAS